MHAGADIIPSYYIATDSPLHQGWYMTGNMFKDSPEIDSRCRVCPAGRIERCGCLPDFPLWTHVYTIHIDDGLYEDLSNRGLIDTAEGIVLMTLKTVAKEQLRMSREVCLFKTVDVNSRVILLDVNTVNETPPKVEFGVLYKFVDPTAWGHQRLYTGLHSTEHGDGMDMSGRGGAS